MVPSKTICSLRELDPSLLISTVRRPAYRRTKPVWSNEDILSDKWRDRHHREWCAPEAKAPDSGIFTLSGAVAFGRGGVSSGRGIIQETILSEAEIPDSLDPKATVEGLTVLLRKPGDSNFGHWLVEILPRVPEFQRAFAGVRLKYAIPKHPVSMQALRLKTLDFFGVDPSDVMMLSDEPTQFETLALMSESSIHSHTHDHLGVLNIRDQAVSRFGAREAGRKLYILRPDGAKRKLFNESEIVDDLASRGFEIFRPETMTFPEQIEAFNGASHVVGVSGAALTNIMWSAPGARVMSLSPASGAEFFFWDISVICGHRFSSVFGPVVGDDKSVHSDFKVDIGVFNEAMSSF